MRKRPPPKSTAVKKALPQIDRHGRTTSGRNLNTAAKSTVMTASAITKSIPCAIAGDTDAAAWGKRADWCDYSAEHDGKTYGVAIFDAPENLRHPTWWMARDYGLFGANPFGRHDYENLKTQPHLGDYTIPAGGSLTLHYRFFFHLGDAKAADVAAHYRDWAAHSADY